MPPRSRTIKYGSIPRDIKEHMSLYITQGRPRPPRIWTPEDPGQPTHADTREELRTFCPSPEPFTCISSLCENTVSFTPSNAHSKFWYWSRRGRCSRCKNLRTCHGLELAELIDIWVAQNRQCYSCSRSLAHPSRPGRAPGGHPDGVWEIKIDHDHLICSKPNHSCKRCRRGLTCNPCNAHKLSLRPLPDDKALSYWLEFLGTEERARLHDALHLFDSKKG